ncbi:MAG TPA: helix-turn-helix domain-containing protein [Candidatus Sulfotelmatobacter sp.]|nr:helix-turn-helix domain-containing protein [Candidatus Sulfotelmatobacter sp.]
MERQLIRDEDLSTLTELGLTLLEAKAYIVLSMMNTASIKIISKNANIVKQDVYRIMPRLQKLGLVEKIVASQIMYKAVPLEEGISTLLQNKARTYANLQVRTTELINRFREVDPDNTVKEDFQFRIISERFLLLRTLDTITDRSRECIDIAQFWEFTMGMLFKHGSSNLENAMKRGVRIRWVTEKHREDNKADERLRSLTRYPLFEIRYMDPPIPIRMAIYDRQDAIMGISYTLDDWVNSLWSNNRMFVEVLGNYYEQLWSSAVTSDSDKATCTELKNKM